MILAINPHNPQARLIERVVRELRSGAVICYPTDTGYGIGCDIHNQKAIKRIHALKKRPRNKPFSFVCADLRDIAEYGHVSNTAYRLMRKCLPGPYTFVLPGTKLVPRIMMSRQKTVGIRVPDHPICQALVTELGNPVVSTSATVDDGGEQQPESEPFMLEQLLGRRVDLYIDAGPAWPDPSTVVDLTSDTPEILREGQGDTSPFS